jgi:hypothetical protein
MRALTVQQPWAWAIVQGGKDVENRTQAWTQRGTIAVHAGLRGSERGLESPLFREAWLRAGHHAGQALALPRGFVIGVVDLVGTHVAAEDCCESEWAEQAYDEHGGRTRRDIVHLELENPRPLAEPVACRGALGLWTLPGDVLDQVLEQLVEATA